MKKIIITLTILVFSLMSFGQNIILHGSTVSLPGNRVKIDKNEAKTHVTKKFRANKIAGERINNLNGQNIYKIGDILIILNSQEQLIKEGHFKSVKRSFDSMFRNDKTYKSQLKQVDGMVIFTMDYQIDGVGYYSIFANNAANSKLISALIEYDISNIDNAYNIGNHLIKNIKFND